MRNPYNVGRWVRGDQHYGRQKLIEHLLTAKDQAIWVIGTRRMGKTSLLRQLESITAHDSNSVYVPLFWDIQACETAEDMAYELFVSMEDESDRFNALGIDIPALQAMDVNRILRLVQRTLDTQGKQLLLLIDEAEALINVARNSNRDLARLRQTLQKGEHRTIMTATKQLTQLDDLMRDWLTSPFLFGFNLVNLWDLDLDSGKALIRQDQNVEQVVVEPVLMENILVYTNRHPYLIQYLCQKLFESPEDDQGRLRPLQAEDLQADHLMTSFLKTDFDHLSPTERQILLAVARQAVADAESISAGLNISSPSRVEGFLYGLYKLGYVRPLLGGWAIGNEFLRRWVVENHDTLARDTNSKVSDENMEALLREGQRFEMTYLQNEAGQIQQQIKELAAQRNSYGDQVPVALSDALKQKRQELEDIRAQIRALGGDLPTDPAPA